MAKKRPNQTPVLIVYVLTMLFSVIMFGTVAYVLLDVFVTQPKLAREAELSKAPASEDDVAAETDYSAARETILFVSEQSGTVNSIALIRVLPDLGTIRIVPVSQYTLSSVSGVEGTIETLYSTGGMTYLKQAVENACGVTCDRYIKISNEGWSGFVDYLGGTSDYYFPQDMYYKNEATGEITSFSQGSATRTLYGDDIRRIMSYPLYTDGNAARLRAVGELWTSLINSACSYNSGSVVGNIQTIFNVIYNNSDTDITQKTFSDVREAYEKLISENSAPATFRLPTGEWDSSGYFNVDEAFKTEILSYFELVEEASVLS